MPPLDLPPPPRGLKGRATELQTLATTIEATAPTRLALVGAGGSGKSMLAAALAHRLARFFEGRASWFRVGSWDFYTLTEMIALRFGLPGGDERVPRLNAFFARTGPRLIVLDNHEDDRAMARLLDAFARANVTFVIPSQTLFQQRTPDEMLGRVVAIRLAVVNGVLAVAMVSSGALAQLVGFRPVIAICGILTAAAGLAGLLVRPIRRA